MYVCYKIDFLQIKKNKISSDFIGTAMLKLPTCSGLAVLYMHMCHNIIYLFLMNWSQLYGEAGDSYDPDRHSACLWLHRTCKLYPVRLQINWLLTFSWHSVYHIMHRLFIRYIVKLYMIYIKYVFKCFYYVENVYIYMLCHMIFRY